MGYYTRYRLTAEPTHLPIEAPLRDLVTEAHLLTKEERGRMVAQIVDVVAEAIKELDDGYGDPFEEQCKWYEHEADVARISERFPTVLFTLTGEGEEAGDLWVKYFKGGKVQVCKGQITYDPFDESKLR